MQGQFAEMVMTDSTIENVGDYSFQIDFLAGLRVNQCNLAKGRRYAVYEVPYKFDSVDLPVLDMRENCWGTASLDSIASWIHMNHYEVEYIPILWNGVQDEKSTLGGLKALFQN